MEGGTESVCPRPVLWKKIPREMSQARIIKEQQVGHHPRNNGVWVRLDDGVDATHEYA